MNSVVYHGSPDNLDIITPHKSTHGKTCIYATKKLVVALTFMGKGNGDLDTMLSSRDGHIELVERREGVLESLYNKDGYIYILDASTFNSYDYLWREEVISFEPSISIKEKIYYPNILNALYEEEKNGNITIYKYPSRPKDVPLDNSDLIDKYIKFENKGIKGSIDYLLRIYPEFKELVKEKIKK